MQIYIKTPRNNTISLHVDLRDSIIHLKRILHEREGIPINQQRLLFSGKQLDDTKTLGYYAIRQESTIDLLLRLRGGGTILSITFDTSPNAFTITISPSGILVIEATGIYTGDLTVNLFTLKNTLTSSSNETVPTSLDNRSYEQDYAGTGTFKITFTIDVTASGFTSYYKQLIRYVFFIEATAPNSPKTATLTKYLFIPNSTNNILMSGITFKSITTVDISTVDKSVVLPPITYSTAKRLIIHFKVTTAASPYIFQIVPNLSDSPTVHKLYDTFPTFDSTIDGNTNQLYLDTINQAVSLISDGINWRILNLYDSPITIALQNSGIAFPFYTTNITSQNVVLYYKYDNTVNTNKNLYISPSIQSMYVIKYLTILNLDSQNNTFRIYFPLNTNLDNVSNINVGWCYIDVTIIANKMASIVFTQVYSGYIILGITFFDNVNISSVSRDTTQYPILTKNINFLAQVGTYNAEIGTANSLVPGYCKLCIFKGNDTANSTYQIYTPANSPGQIIFDGNNNTMINVISKSQSIWFAVYYDESLSLTVILPINYYKGTSSLFITYPDLTGGTGGDV